MSKECVRCDGKGTIEAARAATYRCAENIVIPRMFYRTDIGECLLYHDQNKLIQWGWL
jgi:phosphoribosylamine-glycine ligase